MLRDLHTLDLYVGARRAEVRGRSNLTRLTSQALNVELDRKLLI